MTDHTHNAQAQLAAIREAAGFTRITERAFLRVHGPDAGRWLNGMVTNSIQTLAPGEGCYNFLLNAQGRIQGDCTVYRDPAAEPAAFLLSTAATQAASIQQHLERFIIMDDVELTAVEGLSGILLAGPKALPVVMALGDANHRAEPCSSDAQAPQAIHLKQTMYAGASVWLIHDFSPLVPKFEIWSDPSTISSMLAELEGTEALPISEAGLEWLRLLEARPRFGVDIRDRDLPQETGQAHALHFAKGCYLGQEIVERIRSRGQVHRQFTAFRLSGELPESLPAPLESGGKPVGELTSAGLVPLPEGPALLALGYARREALEPPQTFTYEGGIATPERNI